MSLEYAILGFLQHKPVSGYDMKKLLDSSINHFWSADQSQIYRTLNKLTSDGLIDMELVLSDSRPNSKVYHITAKGREEFLGWLNSPLTITGPRISWLIQVFFAAQLSDEAITSIFEQAAAQLRARMEVYERINKTEPLSVNEVITQRDMFFRGLTLDYGIMLHNSVLQWIEKTIKLIKEKALHQEI